MTSLAKSAPHTLKHSSFARPHCRSTRRRRKSQQHGDMLRNECRRQFEVPNRGRAQVSQWRCQRPTPARFTTDDLGDGIFGYRQPTTNPIPRNLQNQSIDTLWELKIKTGDAVDQYAV